MNRERYAVSPDEPTHPISVPDIEIAGNGIEIFRNISYLLVKHRTSIAESNHYCVFKRSPIKHTHSYSDSWLSISSEIWCFQRSPWTNNVHLWRLVWKVNTYWNSSTFCLFLNIQESSFCQRYCCTTARKFTLHVLDRNRKVTMNLQSDTKSNIYNILCLRK